MSLSSRSLSRSLARLWAAVVVVLAAAVVLPGTAGAEVKLTSVFAKPIEVTRQAGDVYESARCTPDPNNSVAHYTAPYDNDSNPDTPPVDYTYGSSFLYSNWNFNRQGRLPSRDDLPLALTAGERTDFCFGFTLTPIFQNNLPSDPKLLQTKFQRAPEDSPEDPDTWVEKYRDANTSIGEDPADYPDAGKPVDHDDMKDLTITMPEGFAASLKGQTTCSASEFGAGNYLAHNCPATSQVGTSFLRLATIVAALNTAVATGGRPNNSSGIEGGQLFNLTPGPNDLALLGLAAQPVSGIAPVKMLIRAQLTAEGRVRTVIKDVPQGSYLTDDICTQDNVPGDPAGDPGDEITGCVLGQPKPGTYHQPMYVESVGVRIWGKAADHGASEGVNSQPGYGYLAKDFTEYDTACQPVSATATVTTYKGVTSTMSSDPYTLTGCDDLEFKPSIDVSLDEKKPAVPTGATITVGVDQNTSNGKYSALLKDAEVTLPFGMEIGAQAGSREGGLQLCTAAQFAKDSATPAGCPAATKAGTVRIESPLLDRALVGDVFLGPQSAVGKLPDLYLEAAVEGATDDSAPRIKLVGQTSVNEASGQVTTSFTDNPQLRFSELKLTFPGGPTALFTTPRGCGTFTGAAKFTAWSGKTASAEPSVTLDEDCATPAFQPAYGFNSGSPLVGDSAPIGVGITRPDRSPWFDKIVVALPVGMLANLNVVTECADADAAAANCPESSRIATVVTTAGAGDRPYTLTGAMYMTAYRPGHVAYTAIVVRAKVGDIDLGNVVVPGQISLDPLNASLSMATDVPMRFRGIGLNIRSVAVSLDKPNFPLNPTACGPMLTGMGALSEAGEYGSSFTTTSYVGCAGKPFAPAMAADLSSTKKGDHPQLSILIKTRPGDSNLKATVVDLPKFLGADVPNTQYTRGCSVAGFNAGVCPLASRVGAVAATVSITNELITGYVYLVNVPGQFLPGLGMAFEGRYAMRVLSSVYYAGINKDRLRTEFPAIPDVPLTSLALTIGGGPTGPLLIANDSCDTPSFDATFAGQGGQIHKSEAPVKCDKTEADDVSLKWSKKTGLKLALDDFGGRKLHSAKLYLPKGLRWDGKRAKKKNYVRVDVKGVDSKDTKVRRGKTTLTILPKEDTGSELSIKLKYKALKRTSRKKIKKGKKVTFKLRLAFDDGDVQTQKVKVKVP